MCRRSLLGSKIRGKASRSVPATSEDGTLVEDGAEERLVCIRLDLSHTRQHPPWNENGDRLGKRSVQVLEKLKL